MRNGTRQVLLYPLRFEPIYQYRLWGSRRLGDLLTAPLPSGPVDEAWILSDRDDHPSRVADGPLKGQTVGHLLAQSKRNSMAGVPWIADCRHLWIELRLHPEK